MHTSRDEMTEGAEERPLITGSVAALVNARELVINRGSEHGVHRGMKFRVLTTEDIEVTDPETNQSLGRIQRVKVRVQASSVQERMTVCRTYEKTGGGLFNRSLAAQLAEPKYRTLRTGDESYLPPIAENQSYVRRGDAVEEIREE
jgi:hypothetical protein